MDVESVIDIVRSFIDTEASKSQSITDGRSQEIIVNEQIFHLQCVIEQELKSRQVQMKLDTSIQSENIMRSFSYAKSQLEPFPAQAYMFPFYLSFLKNLTPSNELRHYIDLFVDEHAEELRYTDIVITETGATRCKTNIRFASETLKNNFFLIKKLNEKRVLVPSIWGLLYTVTHLELDYPNQVGRIAEGANSLPYPSLEHMISLAQRRHSMERGWLRQLEYLLTNLTEHCLEINDSKGGVKLSKKPNLEKDISAALLELEISEDAKELRRSLIEKCKSLLRY